MNASRHLTLFRRAAPLLVDIVRDMHPDRWQALGISAHAGEKLAACARSRHRLSINVSRLIPEAGDFDSWTIWAKDIDAAPGSWSLLPGTELWRRGLCFGAGCFRPEVAGLVFRADVAAFRNAVGNEVHAFALRQAPLLWRDAAHSLPGLPERNAFPLSDRVRRTAGLALGCWLAGLPSELSARIRLKLPPACDADLAVPLSWPESQRGGWMRMLERVFSLVRQ